MNVQRTALMATIALTTGVLVASSGGWQLAAAAERVTVVLRSGDKITGELDGMNEGRLYVRTSFTEQPKIPIEQVAVLDVGGDAINPPEAERTLGRGAAHVLVPRNGDAVTGTFLSIEGSMGNENPTPPVIVFRTEGGQERRLPVSETRRVYFGNVTQLDSQPPPSSDTTAQATAPAEGERAVVVPATSSWMDAGIIVRRGDRITISASGEITLAPDQGDKATPAGGVSPRKTAQAPLPDAPVGALIARIGASAAQGGRPYLVGAQNTITAETNGRLFFAINDDGLNDNAGQFDVRIKVESTGLSRRR